MVGDAFTGGYVLQGKGDEFRFDLEILVVYLAGDIWEAVG